MKANTHDVAVALAPNLSRNWRKKTPLQRQMRPNTSWLMQAAATITHPQPPSRTGYTGAAGLGAMGRGWGLSGVDDQWLCADWCPAWVGLWWTWGEKGKHIGD